MKVVSSQWICTHFCHVLGSITGPVLSSVKFTAWYFLDNSGNANPGYNSMWGQDHGHNSPWQVFLLLFPLFLLILKKSAFGFYLPSEYNPLRFTFTMGESLSLVFHHHHPGSQPFFLPWLLTLPVALACALPTSIFDLLTLLWCPMPDLCLKNPALLLSEGQPFSQGWMGVVTAFLLTRWVTEVEDMQTQNQHNSLPQLRWSRHQWLGLYVSFLGLP